MHVYSGNLYGGIETLLATLARNRGLTPGVEHEFALCHEGRLAAEIRRCRRDGPSAWPARFSRPWTVWRPPAAGAGLGRKAARPCGNPRLLDACACSPRRSVRGEGGLLDARRACGRIGSSDLPRGLRPIWRSLTAGTPPRVCPSFPRSAVRGALLPGRPARGGRSAGFDRLGCRLELGAGEGETSRSCRPAGSRRGRGNRS